MNGAERRTWLIGQYVRGQLSDAEVDELRELAGADPGFAFLLKGLRAVKSLGPPGARGRPIDPDQLLTLLHQKIATRFPRTRAAVPRSMLPFGAWRAAHARLCAGAAVLGVAAVAVGAGYAGWTRTHRGADVAVVWSDSTARGQRKSVTMPDGSRAELAPASTLRYLATRRSGRQLVMDSGEVYLSIVHDPRFPLVLRAGRAVIRDVGTRLLVRAYSSNSDVQVLVTDGTIALSAAGEREQVLRRGTLGVVTPTGTTTLTGGVDTTEYLAWTRDQLVFRDTPFAQVVQDLGRWYDLDVVLRDAKLATVPIRGSLPTNKMDDALDALASAARASWTRRGRAVAFYTSRKRNLLRAQAGPAPQRR